MNTDDEEQPSSTSEEADEESRAASELEKLYLSSVSSVDLLVSTPLSLMISLRPFSPLVQVFEEHEVRVCLCLVLLPSLLLVSTLPQGLKATFDINVIYDH